MQFITSNTRIVLSIDPIGFNDYAFDLTTQAASEITRYRDPLMMKAIPKYLST